MSNEPPRKAKLLYKIPRERMRLLAGNNNVLPQEGDVVVLDQCYQDESGCEMVLAYFQDNETGVQWELEVYESELSQEPE